MAQGEFFDGQSVDLPQKTEAEQQAFYDVVLDRAVEAQARAGALHYDLDVAGLRLRLIFAGDRLAREFLGALGHLMTPPHDECDAVFHVWDSASTGVAMPPPPCSRTAFTDRGDLWGFASHRFRSAFHWSEYSVCVLDHDTGIGVYWVETAETLPYWAKSSPMRTMFHWLMERRGFQLVHAAAIGTDRGGVLITGKGGVGKSTTSVTGLAAGMTFIGDDYLIVGLDPEPTAYTLYSTAKLAPEQLAGLPELAALIHGAAPAPGEKAVIYLHPEHSGRIARALPLRWLLTPRFGDGEETRFEPVSSIELHRAAAFTTMSQLPHAGVATHRFIGALVDRLSGARIVLGRDVRGVPRAITALLDRGANLPPSPCYTAQPLVSVVIPVFNGAHFLREAIDAVLAQDYSALEIIVVDDGSTDEIERAVAELPIDVRFFRQANAGPAAARNRGVRDASGEIVAFLDVDDLWPANNLASMVAAFADDAPIDVVLGRAQLARIIPDQEGGLDYVGNPDESFPHYIGAGLYRRAAFEKIGLFDESLRFGEDSDWFARAREQGLVVDRLDQISLIVRRHEANMTRGKSMVELHVLRAFKKALDRSRDRRA